MAFPGRPARVAHDLRGLPDLAGVSVPAPFPPQRDRREDARGHAGRHRAERADGRALRGRPHGLGGLLLPRPRRSARRRDARRGGALADSRRRRRPRDLARPASLAVARDRAGRQRGRTAREQRHHPQPQPAAGGRRRRVRLGEARRDELGLVGGVEQLALHRPHDRADRLRRRDGLALPHDRRRLVRLRAASEPRPRREDLPAQGLRPRPHPQAREGEGRGHLGVVLLERARGERRRQGVRRLPAARHQGREDRLHGPPTARTSGWCAGTRRSCAARRSTT